jgi:hypothetical protein
LVLTITPERILPTSIFQALCGELVHNETTHLTHSYICTGLPRLY